MFWQLLQKCCLLGPCQGTRISLASGMLQQYNRALVKQLLGSFPFSIKYEITRSSRPKWPQRDCHCSARHLDALFCGPVQDNCLTSVYRASIVVIIDSCLRTLLSTSNSSLTTSRSATRVPQIPDQLYLWSVDRVLLLFAELSHTK